MGPPIGMGYMPELFASWVTIPNLIALGQTVSVYEWRSAIRGKIWALALASYVASAGYQI